MDAQGDGISAVLHRSLHADFPHIVGSEGSYLFLDDGRKILDASGGASVACLGHSDKRVEQAMVDQIKQVSYCASVFYTSRAYEDLCRELVGSTGGHMARAYIVNSGSEAMEAALKLARQYFLEKRPRPEPARVRFIARRQSYHGTTLGALSVGGHAARRANFQPLLIPGASLVSPCYPYRGQAAGETDEAYVARLADELEAEFQRVGPETVCAFVAEPVVGAALGCVAAVPGYFRAMRAVCERHGALLVLDEVMCGMGRTGTAHAWQQEAGCGGPDIQTVGKCLGGGFQPIAGLLASHKVVDALAGGTGAFVHGHTYQGHPVACAAALKVQKIIREENLLANVSAMGQLLSSRLRALLSDHRHVGEIRGRGLFWALELVADRATRQTFPASAGATAMALAERGLREPYCLALYPCGGTADGVQGDHLIVSPRYNTDPDEVELIASTLHRLIVDFFGC